MSNQYSVHLKLIQYNNLIKLKIACLSETHFNTLAYISASFYCCILNSFQFDLFSIVILSISQVFISSSNLCWSKGGLPFFQPACKHTFQISTQNILPHFYQLSFYIIFSGISCAQMAFIKIIPMFTFIFFEKIYIFKERYGLDFPKMQQE